MDAAFTVGVTLAFAVMGTVMALEDVRSHRVRNIDITILGAVLLGTVTTWAIVAPSWDRALFALLGGVSYTAVFLLVAALARGQLGSGDVWVAGLTGWFLGAVAPSALVVGWAMPFALSALPALVLWRLRGRTAELAFIPFIVMSAPLSVLTGQILAT